MTQFAYQVRDFAGWWVRQADADADAGTTDFVASTAEEDRMGDFVEQTWRLKEWRANPVILNNHNRDQVVGRGLYGRVPKESGNLEIRVLWDLAEANPLGRLVGHQHLNGFRKTGSVGFIPERTVSRLDLPDDDPRKQSGLHPWEAGSVFLRPKLLEFSSAPIPANASAAQRYLGEVAGGTEDPDEQVRRILDETLAARVRDSLLEVARCDPEFRRIVRAYALIEPAPPPERAGWSTFFRTQE